MLPVDQARYWAEQVRQVLRYSLGTVPNDQLVVTCEECVHNADCEFAFDLYNTGGDCLAVK